MRATDMARLVHYEALAFGGVAVGLRDIDASENGMGACDVRIAVRVEQHRDAADAVRLLEARIGRVLEQLGEDDASTVRIAVAGTYSRMDQRPS